MRTRNFSVFNNVFTEQFATYGQLINMDLIFIPVSALFVFVSTFCAYHGIKHAINAHRMFQAGFTAEGTVIRIQSEQRQRKGRTYTEYTPVIAFETVWREKREITYADPFRGNIFKIGDKVKLWYDQNDPAIFTLGGWHFVKDIASFFMFALCFGLPGWTLLVTYIRQYTHF